MWLELVHHDEVNCEVFATKAKIRLVGSWPLAVAAGTSDRRACHLSDLGLGST